ncbi:hypothetical protein FNV43_RR07769 [Rhamnella rubrinervis]|uniref:Ubiquitin-like domain-containing protein n=1 Tax=Rhamnella rubrinervis TaxID=2594499 RepID=A0A8K0MN13_9ROSA|nr:hypothetical protein FNV43_RR07769 [Rhamnella rubrinervis]
MPATATLRELKENIQDNFGVFGLAANKQELMFNGNRLLEDYMLLKDLGITSESVVHLYEKKIIWVKNTDGIGRYFYVNDGMTVADVKKTVGDYFDHFNTHSAVLQHEDGQYLEDEQLTVKAANIGDNTARLIYTFRC